MHKPYRLILWGTGQLGRAVAQAALRRGDCRLLGARVFSEAKRGRDVGELIGVDVLGIQAGLDTEAILVLEADCVIFAPAADADPEVLAGDVCRLLASGKNVISTVAFPAATSARLLEACRQGGASLHTASLYPGFMIERLTLALSRALSAVDHIRCVASTDFSIAPPGMWGGLVALGFAGEPTRPSPAFAARMTAVEAAIVRVAGTLYGAMPSDIRFEQSFRTLPAEHDCQVGGFEIGAGQAAVLCGELRAFLGEQHFFTAEEHWYLGSARTWRGAALPFGGCQEDFSYSIEMQGGLTRLESQLELELDPSCPPFTALTTKAVLDAIGPVCAAEPGIVHADTRPRYQSDMRLGA